MTPEEFLNVQPLPEDGGMEAQLIALYTEKAELGHELGITDAQEIINLVLSLETEIRRLATLDWTTSVHNRHTFFNLAWRELERAQRYDRFLSILMLDIDHFKQINDKYGDVFGDKILQIVSAACIDSLRGGVDLLGRYGSENFAILLPETEISKAQQIAERLNQLVAETPFTTDKGETLFITVSLGVAGFDPKKTLGLGELFNQAGEALKIAKQAGRNRVHVWQVP